ncbi:MAG: hypothetical protein AAGA31_21735, partial [Bacteroidota bacterium]
MANIVIELKARRLPVSGWKLTVLIKDTKTNEHTAYTRRVAVYPDIHHAKGIAVTGKKLSPEEGREHFPEVLVRKLKP